MELSIEQQIAFDKYLAGHNVFITGPGGTGKSELIRMIYRHAHKSFKDIYVTALTGCASILLNCKATTLHSWAGIGLAKAPFDVLVMKIKKNKFLNAVWNEIHILVVDEVSMLSLKLFNLLNDLGKKIRNNQEPFGGIQLIFSGDFYQLPPVGDKDDLDTQRFCFESDDWDVVFNRDCQIELKKIFRQTEHVYSSILNQIREGRIKKKAHELLLEYVDREIDESMIIEPTKLFPTKKKVEQINISKMLSLDSEERVYKINYLTDLEIPTRGEKQLREQFDDKDIIKEFDFLAGNLLCEKEIKIKIGAQVMCIVNIKNVLNDILICNGSQGVVKDYCKLTGYPKVKYNNGVEMVMTPHVWVSENIPGIGISQIPLILSWAITIHKSQGATLDAAEIDVGSGIFECGQTYVALSRVKNLNGLYLTSFDARKIKINKSVKEYYESLRTYHETEQTNKKELHIPLVIAEEVPTAIPTRTSAINNRFLDYQYTEAVAELVELAEETYNTDSEIIKVVKF